MFTGIFSDTEGWNVFHTAETREEIVQWFEEQGIYIDSGVEIDWWNPAPMIICGNEHTVEQFEDSFRYY